MYCQFKSESMAFQALLYLILTILLCNFQFILCRTEIDDESKMVWS